MWSVEIVFKTNSHKISFTELLRKIFRLNIKNQFYRTTIDVINLKWFSFRIVNFNFSFSLKGLHIISLLCYIAI